MKNSKSSAQNICIIALMAAITAILAQISIPMPMGVPLTMQTFAVTLAGVLLGSKRGGMAILVYVLLGAVGAPVFAGFSGGIQNLVGPTGGFIISFPIMAYVIGLGVEMRNKKKGMFVSMIILGTVLNYVIGVIMFVLVMDSTVMTALTACVFPFIPTAVIKAVAAAVVGLQMRKRLGGVLQTC